jgi:hypothetical protein
MYCWNALSTDQQEFLRTQGYLEMGYRPEGECPRGAAVEITTEWDEFPGPRFYCIACAIQYLWDQAAARFQQQHPTPTVDSEVSQQ